MYDMCHGTKCFLSPAGPMCCELRGIDLPGLSELVKTVTCEWQCVKRWLVISRGVLRHLWILVQCLPLPNLVSWEQNCFGVQGLLLGCYSTEIWLSEGVSTAACDTVYMQNMAFDKLSNLWFCTEWCSTWALTDIKLHCLTFEVKFQYYCCPCIKISISI